MQKLQWQPLPQTSKHAYLGAGMAWNGEIRTECLIFVNFDPIILDFGTISSRTPNFDFFLICFLDQNWNVYEIPISDSILIFENRFINLDFFSGKLHIISILLYILYISHILGD